MLIGKSDRVTTSLGPDECAQRLRAVRWRFMLGSKVDSSGFSVARGGRTAIRMRGSFVAQPNAGTLVVYRIEWIPAAIVSLAIAFPLGLGVLILMLVLAHQGLLILLWLIPFAVVVAAGNVWISEIQARRLVAFVRRQLEAN